MTKNRINHGSARTRTTMTLALAGMLVLPACDILDVDNPNNLLEEDIQQVTAADAAVNGALSSVARTTSRVWQLVLIAADELVWIGSRDAWQALDHGFLSDPSNEFTDQHFPYLGEARWNADHAEELLEGHVEENPENEELKKDLARAHLVAGTIYMIIGEIQQDFAFSDRAEAAPPVGPENMFTVLDQAIEKLSTAMAVAGEVGDEQLATRALAMRARAHHSRAIWDKIKPTPSTGDPLVDAPGAVADAQAVLDRVNADWTDEFTYSPETITNNMAAWINGRAENQFDTTSVVTVDRADLTAIQGVRAEDPISGVIDPVITAKLVEWKDGALSGNGTDFPPLTLTSARMMRLILAEDALRQGDAEGFATHINHVRAMDDLTPYTGQLPELDMLISARRSNLFLMGLRLNDMYRFGIQAPDWQPNSDAIQQPGTLLPISITEIRANPFIGGAG